MRAAFKMGRRCEALSKRRSASIFSCSFEKSHLGTNIAKNSIFQNQYSNNYRNFASTSVSNEPSYNFTTSALDMHGLPAYTFPGKIIEITDAAHETEELKNHFLNEKILGFDTEARPVGLYTNISTTDQTLPTTSDLLSKAGQPRSSVIQIASREVCLVYRPYILNDDKTNESSKSNSKIDLYQRFPLLQQILADASITKAAQGFRQECEKLTEEFRNADFRNCVDLHELAVELNCHPRSLRALTAIFLNKRLRKDEQLSDWEVQVLSPFQLDYAACDAVASGEILRAVRKRVNEIRKNHVYKNCRFDKDEKDLELTPIAEESHIWRLTRDERLFTIGRNRATRKKDKYDNYNSLPQVPLDPDIFAKKVPSSNIDSSVGSTSSSNSTHAANSESSNLDSSNFDGTQKLASSPKAHLKILCKKYNYKMHDDGLERPEVGSSISGVKAKIILSRGVERIEIKSPNFHNLVRLARSECAEAGVKEILRREEGLGERANEGRGNIGVSELPKEGKQALNST